MQTERIRFSNSKHHDNDVVTLNENIHRKVRPSRKDFYPFNNEGVVGILREQTD